MFDAKTIRLAESLRPDLDFSVMGTEQFAILKIVENASGGGVVPVYDADITNGIASFSGVTKSKPLVSLKLNIPVTQTGSGTPSPDNIRDIVGVQGLTIGQTSGYGEYFRGLLNGTYGFVDLGSLTWNPQNTNETCNRWRASSDILIASRSYKNINNFTDDGWFQGVSVTSTTTTTNMIDTRTNLIYLNIKKTVFDGNVTEFNSWAQGKYLIYELAEPSTPITPQEFATLCQAFGITGNTYPITFGQTVYSANLDVLTGLLTVSDDYEIRTIDENSNLTVSNGIFALDNFFDIEGDTNSVMCNVYQRGTNQQNTSSVMTNNPDYSFCCRSISARTRLMIKDTRFETVEDYKTWLENNPVKIYVKKANPQPYTIQLTPTVINTLVGENVIFADVGDITECKYTRK